MIYNLLDGADKLNINCFSKTGRVFPWKRNLLPLCQVSDTFFWIELPGSRGLRSIFWYHFGRGAAGLSCSNLRIWCNRLQKIFPGRTHGQSSPFLRYPNRMPSKMPGNPSSPGHFYRIFFLSYLSPLWASLSFLYWILEKCSVWSGFKIPPAPVYKGGAIYPRRRFWRDLQVFAISVDT